MKNWLRKLYLFYWKLRIKLKNYCFWCFTKFHPFVWQILVFRKLIIFFQFLKNVWFHNPKFQVWTLKFKILQSPSLDKKKLFYSFIQAQIFLQSKFLPLFFFLLLFASATIEKRYIIWLLFAFLFVYRVQITNFFNIINYYTHFLSDDDERNCKKTPRQKNIEKFYETMRRNKYF